MSEQRPSEGVPLDDAAEWHRIAEERRVQLERLQQQRLYALAAALLGRVRRARWLLRRLVDPSRALVLLLVRSLLAVPRRLSAPRREADLRAALARLTRPAPDHTGPRPDDITAVIVTAAQPERLDALLGALSRVGVGALVVDNAGVPATAAIIARHAHATGIRLSAPRPYAAANDVAIARVATPWMLLLNDDVAPLEDTWLDRMSAAATGGTIAVGAQLIHGRRRWLGGAALDLTVQHAGIGFALAGPLATPVHLERGRDPDPRMVTRVVPAATAACLLVDVTAYRATGGFTHGFDYGMEDVDLCLRLAARGQVAVALDAVLLHEEGATRLRGERRARASRQQANRRLFDARNAPGLRRRLTLAALAAQGDVDAVTLTVGVVGPVPPALAALALSLPTLRIGPHQPDGWDPFLVVTDLAALDGARASGGVLLGWLGGADLPSVDAVAHAEAIERLDVIVTADTSLATAIAAAHPTVPLRPSAPTDAADARHLLHELARAERWSIRIGAPGGRAGGRWGDAPVAEALRRELRAHGHVVRVATREDWGGAFDTAADVTLHLKGRGVAPVASGQTNIVWVISHPSELAPGELDAADLVLAASVPLTEHLAARTATPVRVLHQAADARTLVAGPHDPALASRVLFIGNTRSVPRPAVLGAIEAGLDLTLIGDGWARYVDPRLVLRDAVPNAELARWYRSADVVLNDHWDEMRRWGLVSNRVLEVLACGGLVVSDALDGLDALTDGAVPTYTGPDELVAIVTALLDDAERRAELAARGQAAVLAAHTWRHRAETLIELVDALPAATVRGTAGEA